MAISSAFLATYTTLAVIFALNGLVPYGTAITGVTTTGFHNWTAIVAHTARQEWSLLVSSAPANTSSYYDVDTGTSSNAIVALIFTLLSIFFNIGWILGFLLNFLFGMLFYLLFSAYFQALKANRAEAGSNANIAEVIS